MKTIMPNADAIAKKWYVIDAQDQVLGRVASQVALLLKGKHRPEYTPHLDLGDHVIVINAEKVKVTGRKSDQKVYTQYSGYPGGLRTKMLRKLFEEKPENVIRHAVKGMLPKNRLGRQMIKKMKIYVGNEHPHEAQKPEVLPDNLRRV